MGGCPTARQAGRINPPLPANHYSFTHKVIENIRPNHLSKGGLLVTGGFISHRQIGALKGGFFRPICGLVTSPLLIWAKAKIQLLIGTLPTDHRKLRNP